MSMIGPEIASSTAPPSLGGLIKISSSDVLKTVPKGVTPPLSYLKFLENVGYGTVQSGIFTIYSGLVEPKDVFGIDDQKLDGILLFGDDLSGYLYGFSVINWRIVEVDQHRDVISMGDVSFEEFLNRKIAS